MTLTLLEINNKLDSLKLERKCVTCGVEYQDINNMGQLQCRWHPGALLKFDEGKEWSCCNADKKALGCCKCDHISQGEHHDKKPVFLECMFFDYAGGLCKPPVKDSFIELRERKNKQGEVNLTESIIVFYRHTMKSVH